MNQNRHCDVIIIGAGMSGLASAIRASMFDRKVILIEAHSIPGGLNSYYQRGKRELDVGLHALTNMLPEKLSSADKKKPFFKMLKQLRMSVDDFKLRYQAGSKIVYPEKSLAFTNDIEDLKNQIRANFPLEYDAFLHFLQQIESFNEVSLDHSLSRPSREVLQDYFRDEELIDMLLCPLLIYGSSWENDLEFYQFIIMFKSIYLEGFGRPHGGVRVIIDLLLKKFLEHSERTQSQILYKKRVKKILQKITSDTKDPSIEHVDREAYGVELESGEVITAAKIISTIGLIETDRLLQPNDGEKNGQDNIDQTRINFLTRDRPSIQSAEGKLSFCETIFFTDRLPRDYNIKESIIFYNKNKRYQYKNPIHAFDDQSAVLCFSNNFSSRTYFQEEFREGVMRVTFMANALECIRLREHDRDGYRALKQDIALKARSVLEDVCGEKINILYQDVFTPATIKRYTDHHKGLVYGAELKLKDGKTLVKNLFIAGTDQGFLGIVGSILSGISMTNLHVLMGDD